ncbi:MAG: clan AA aspartic protease [Gemmatimonadetes bacterium]|nr:clan AA aspartic protease [Gemmatimonadota bacterium]
MTAILAPRALALLLFFMLTVTCAAESDHARHGMPQPGVELRIQPAVIPFMTPAAFPAPVVEVTIGDKGGYRFVVDTGMSGTVLIRKALADELGLREVGHAMVGDASGHGTRTVPLVTIDRMATGDLDLSSIVALAMEPNADHAASIPDDLDGILGMQLFRELLVTFDYPAAQIRIEPHGPDWVESAEILRFDQSKSAIEIQLGIGDQIVPFFVDSAHRGTLTLPMSYAGRLPLSEPLTSIAPVATVSTTYTRSRSRLNTSVVLAGSTFLNPPVVFADEHSPLLMGYGILRYFTITIDQMNGRIRFHRDGTDPIDDVDLVETGMKESPGGHEG